MHSKETFAFNSYPWLYLFKLIHYKEMRVKIKFQCHFVMVELQFKSKLFFWEISSKKCILPQIPGLLIKAASCIIY